MRFELSNKEEATKGFEKRFNDDIALTRGRNWYIEWL